MDGAVTKEAAVARWRRDLEEAEAHSLETWHRDITAGFSEFEWLTLVTEILMPVRNEYPLDFEEARQPARQSAADSRGDGGESIDEEFGTEGLGLNLVYSVILAAAAACNRWLKEDLGPGLRDVGRDFETPMTLDPASDTDLWARERTKPLPEQPAGDSDDDVEKWLHWADLRTSGTLPEETATREEWSETLGHSMTLVREAVHRLTLARLYMRAGDPALLESNVAVQTAENLYRVLVWLTSTLQAWGLALVRVHNAVSETHQGP